MNQKASHTGAAAVPLLRDHTSALCASCRTWKNSWTTSEW